MRGGTIIIQPDDFIKILRLESERDLDIVLKTLRFLFDTALYMKDGSQISSSLVTFTKVSGHHLVASSPGDSIDVTFRVSSGSDSSSLVRELVDAISTARGIKIPV